MFLRAFLAAGPLYVSSSLSFASPLNSSDSDQATSSHSNSYVFVKGDFIPSYGPPRIPHVRYASHIDHLDLLENISHPIEGLEKRRERQPLEVHQNQEEQQQHQHQQQQNHEIPAARPEYLYPVWMSHCRFLDPLEQYPDRDQGRVLLQQMQQWVLGRLEQETEAVDIRSGAFILRLVWQNPFHATWPGDVRLGGILRLPSFMRVRQERGRQEELEPEPMREDTRSNANNDAEEMVGWVTNRLYSAFRADDHEPDRNAAGAMLELSERFFGFGYRLFYNRHQDSHRETVPVDTPRRLIDLLQSSRITSPNSIVISPTPDPPRPDPDQTEVEARQLDLTAHKEIEEEAANDKILYTFVTGIFLIFLLWYK